MKIAATSPVANPAPAIDRLSPTHRPAGPVAGYHRWSDLLFIHWRVPAGHIQSLLPSGLTVDTWEGDAWIGLVPFRTSGVRPRGLPALPGLSRFPETNVRTYVHRAGRDPGVWFFSLEASNALAVLIARRWWNLNYYWASMSIERAADRLRYRSRRIGRQSKNTAPIGCDIEAQIGPLIGADDPQRPLPPGKAEPGSLEHFLIERYILYTSDAAGRLRIGRVHHRPYAIRQAELLHLEETLLATNGIRPSQPPCHAVYCDPVAVEVFPLRPVAVE